MKLSQDLYDAGILRHQRTGPSDDWAFDEPGASLSRVVSGTFGRLRSWLFAVKGRSGGNRGNRMRHARGGYLRQGGLR